MPDRTLRETLIAMLEGQRWSFHELRQELDLTVRRLADDLEHVERSVRGRGRRLRVDPPRCRDCGLELAGSSRSHAPPGRCPRCRSHRIDGPWMEIPG
jgi:predicted Zn-ribbon and HTH transcriptional regulator